MHRKKVLKVLCSSVVSNSVTPWTVAHRLLCPWDFPGKNTGVCCHFLLQGIFPIQRLNPGLLHCRQALYHLSHQGSPEGAVHIYRVDNYSATERNEIPFAATRVMWRLSC